jgi:hypothetical protein
MQLVCAGKANIEAAINLAQMFWIVKEKLGRADKADTRFFGKTWCLNPSA